MLSEDLFQRLTVGATFSRTLNIFTKRFDIFLLISLLVYVPLVAMSVTVFGYIGSSLHTLMDTMGLSNRYLQQSNYYSNNESVLTDDTYHINDNNDQASDLDPAAFQDFATQLFSIAGQLFVEMLLFLIFAVVAEVAMIYAVGQLYVNRDPRFSECLKKGFSKWCTLFGASMLVLLGLQFGNLILLSILVTFSHASITLYFLLAFVVYVAWFVFLIYVFVPLVILSPSIVIENLGPIDGIKRAWDLAQSNRCYIFCTVFCFGLIYNLLILIINGIVVSVAGKEATFSAWGVLVSMLPAIIYLPLVCILKTIVYLNIRVQREGMNRGVLIDNLDGMITGEAMVVDAQEKTYEDKPSKFTPVSINVSKGDIV
mmetsp:Transcript_38153/g.43549  ORF Transcript_38153/g.43549 Transcript_38153/m.43549 type:complete len:370 (-) Transcript_38153:141-1250(-)